MKIYLNFENHIVQAGYPVYKPDTKPGSGFLICKTGYPDIRFLIF